MTMGDLIDLELRRTGRDQLARAAPVYYFDVTCPMSYLAAERVERSLGQVDWVGVDGSAIRGGAPTVDDERPAPAPSCTPSRCGCR